MRQQHADPGQAATPWHLKRSHLLPLTLATFFAATLSWLVTTHVQARVSSTETVHLKLPSQKDFRRERALFLKAEKAIESGTNEDVATLLAQLKHYPLLPYLEYLQIKNGMHDSKRISRTDIDTFFQRHPKSRLTSRLRTQWLKHLADRGQWPVFLEYYRPSNNVEMECHHRNALLSTQRSAEALKGIKDLWMVGRSQPSACDRIFNYWQKSSSFKAQYYSERAHLALKAKQFTFARFLADKTSTKTDDKRVADWTELYRHPERLSKKTRSINISLDQSMILMALERLLRRDLDAFKAQWKKYKNQLSTSSDAFNDFSHFVARWYSWHYYTDSWQWLTLADPQLQDRELLERRIRLALYYRDWAAVRNWIGALPLAQQQEDAWRYWRARAAFELVQQKALADLTINPRAPSPLAKTDFGNDLLAFHKAFMSQLRDPTQSFSGSPDTHSPAQILATIRASFTALAQSRSFYGFIASEILQQPLSMNHRPLSLPDAQRWEIEKRPGVQAALEWLRLDRFTQARSAWYHDIQPLPAKTKSLAAKVAREWGWHHQAILTAASSDHKDDLSIRFPLGFFNIVYEQTIEQEIYADWTFALIRQESAFKNDAQSSVGALGLMQLMPGTAKLVSRRAGEQYPGNRALLSARTNIQTGTRYMAKLFKQFKGNLLLATAGYNAGPHRAISWQHPTDAIPGDLWIETIPIEETRDYVKNIMTYQAIYRWQLGRPPRLSSSLVQVPPLSETNY